MWLAKQATQHSNKTDLIELQLIEETVKLPVFGGLLKLEIMLLKPMESKLGLVINKDLERLSRRVGQQKYMDNVRNTAYVGHELLAGSPNILGQGSAKHHDLLVVRGSAEDLLNIAAHVCCKDGMGV